MNEKLAHAIRSATVMAEPLGYVIANHLDDGPPIVLDGDVLLPAVAARALALLASSTTLNPA